MVLYHRHLIKPNVDLVFLLAFYNQRILQNRDDIIWTNFHGNLLSYGLLIYK